MSERQRFTKLLRFCTRNLLLDQGIKLHAAAVKMGFEFDMILSNNLVDMYGKCGRTDTGQKVFDRMPERNVVSWTVLMGGYLQQGFATESLSLFIQMVFSGFKPNEFTLSMNLKACNSLGIHTNSEQIHVHCIKTGFEGYPEVGNSLIDTYAKCKRINEASQVFDKMPFRNLISWNTMIAGYTHEGNGRKSLLLFLKMQEQGETPDGFTFASILKACSSLGAISSGIQIHASLITNGFFSQTILASALVDLYVKCERLSEARSVFDRIVQKNVVSWTVMITGYAQEGKLREAMGLFFELQRADIQIDSFILSGIMGVFSDFALVEQGKQIHSYTIKIPSGSDVSVANSIINMYLKCGLTKEAHQVFDKMPERNKFSPNGLISRYLKKEKLEDARLVFDQISSPDIFAWTMMITGYSRTGRIGDALQLFDRMPIRDIASWNAMIAGCLECRNLDLAHQLFDKMPERNVVSWTTMVNGFARFGRLEMAEQLFLRMPWRDTAAWNSIISGFCRNGRIEEAYRLFEEMPNPNVISWTAMMGGFDQHGQSDKALSLFWEMRIAGVEPTSSTFATVITACSNLSASDQGVQLHAHLLKTGNISDYFIFTSLITLYANFGKFFCSRKLFDGNPQRNVALWTALITGYGLNNKHEEALKVFYDMVRIGIELNESTFTSALNSCCGLEALDTGKAVHTRAVKLGVDLDVFVGNSLTVMYSKCGSMEDAKSVFSSLKLRNLVSWNAIIIGCAQHGHGHHALEFFDQMVRAGVKPDEITFVGLLTACSHSKLLDRGRYFFELLNQDPSVNVQLEHYACMVDILGRSGRLEEAEKFIKDMPIEPNSVVWLALLSSCRVHSNLEIGRRTARTIFKTEPHNSGAYILLSNIYASAGKWNAALQIRKLMTKRGVKKMRGHSWITIKGSRHEFLAGDKSHPMSKEIYKKLDWLGGKLREAGYVSDRSYALHDVEDEQKDAMLSYHSERLAIGFGLLNTVAESTIRVIKNLRICGDCHSAIKLMSKIVRREIIVRDSTRFHHFKDGICSCGGYW